MEVNTMADQQFPQQQTPASTFNPAVSQTPSTPPPAVKPRTSLRGFASMDPAKQREIASKGGQAAHQSGRAHEFDSREAAEAGRKGGFIVSQNRAHMARIGAQGGRARAL